MKWYNSGDLWCTIIIICLIGGCVTCNKIDADYKIEVIKLEIEAGVNK